MADRRTAASFIRYGLVVMTVTHILTHAFGNIHTAIFSILRTEFTLTLQQLGVIAAIPPLCQALLAVPAGLLSDRVGARRMVLLSFAVAVAGALLASQAATPPVFIVAVSLVYVNTTFYHPASYSYTTKLYPPRERPKAMGLHGAGGTLGHALGPLSVSVLIGVLALAWRQVYFVLAIPMLLGIALVLFIRDETAADFPAAPPIERDGQPPEAASLLTASLATFLVFSGLRMMASSMISSFLVLYLQDVRQLSIALASLVSSGRMLLGFIAAPLGGVLAARYGEKRWLLGMLAVSYLLLGLSVAAPSVVGFIVLYVASGFCNTLVMAARSSIMAKLSPRHRRGLGYALYFLPGSVMGAVAPVLAGYLGAAFGFDAIFYVSLGISVLALGLLKLGVHVA